MLDSSASLDIILLNIILIMIWHLIVLFFSTKLDVRFFNPNRKIFLKHSWEQDGKFYINTLKIKYWKDKLPQYIAKNGFSKRSINTKYNKEYIERFIFETCRAEWNHIMNCMYFVISFYVNSFFYAVTFSVIPIIANLPFIFIQRFNRIRLRKFAEKAYGSTSFASINNM